MILRVGVMVEMEGGGCGRWNSKRSLHPLIIIISSSYHHNHHIVLIYSSFHPWMFLVASLYHPYIVSDAGCGGMEMEGGGRWKAEWWQHLSSSPGSTKMEWVGMERICRKKKYFSPLALQTTCICQFGGWLESNPSHDWDWFLDRQSFFLFIYILARPPLFLDS